MHGALIVGVIVTSLTAAALFATLATVGGTVFSRSVVQRVESLPATDTSLTLSGPVTRPNVAKADAAIREQMNETLGGSRFSLDRAEVARALDLPTAFGPARSKLVRPMAATGITAHATLLSGSWPQPPAPGQPLDVALAADVAKTLALHVGDQVRLTDSFTDAPVPVRISGVFRQIDPESPYWQLSPVGPTGSLISGDLTEYGPVIVDPAALSGGALQQDSVNWVVRPDLSRAGAADLRPLANKVAQLASVLSQSTTLVAITAKTGLPQALSAAAGDAWAARSGLAVATALSALLALAALLLAVGLLRTRREIEAATLRARGGAGWQLSAINGGEALICGLIAAAGGAYGGETLGEALAPSATPLGAPTLGMWLAAGVAAFVGALIMTTAAAGASSPVAAWARRSRQSTVLAVARVGGDAAVVALAVVAVWQLREISLSSTTNDGIDPVLVAAPAFALAGATLVLVRAVPLAARLGERWAGRRRGLLGPLVTWDVSRHPARFTGAMLLSVLAVTTGVFALTMHASWHTSQLDQAAFDAGSDVRVGMVTAGPADASAIAGSSDVTAATPLVPSPVDGGAVVAVDSRTASAIALRPDLSPVPVARLWSGIAPDGNPGLAIPGRPARIAVTASLRTDTAPTTPAPPVNVVFTVLDADGVAYRIPGSALPADAEPHVVSGAVGDAGHALYPLRLVNVAFAGSFGNAAISVSQVASADTATGPAVPFASGTAFGLWEQTGQTALGTPTNPVPCVLIETSCKWLGIPALGQFTLDAVGPPESVPGIATKSFLLAKGAHVGDSVPVTVNGVALSVRIVGQIDAFPTESALPVVVLDLTTLQNAVLASGSPPMVVQQWLLRTRDGAVPRGLPAAASAISRSDVTAALLNDPLGVPSQRTWIVIAIAAAALAVAGGSMNVAAEIRARRRDTALLAALGVSRWQQLRGLCTERLLLGTVSSGLGLLMGVGLSALLVVPVTPSAVGTAPVPPVLVTYAWSWSIALTAVVALGPVAAAAISTLRRPDAASELRLAEAI
jgi:hypothetical protein